MYTGEVYTLSDLARLPNEGALRENSLLVCCLSLVFIAELFFWPHQGPTALKLRPNLTESRGESVERCLCFRFSIWPWQFMAKRDEKAICERLQTGKRYRFLAEKEMSRSTLGGR